MLLKPVVHCFFTLGLEVGIFPCDVSHHLQTGFANLVVFGGASNLSLITFVTLVTGAPILLRRPCPCAVGPGSCGGEGNRNEACLARGEATIELHVFSNAGVP